MTSNDNQKTSNNYLELTYTSLREEILKRLEIRYQLISYALGAFAALMTLGLSEGVPRGVLFLYPITVTGLVIAFVDNHNRLKLAASFLRRYNMPWETALKCHRDNERQRFWSRERLGELSIIGIFVGTQSLALAFGLRLIISGQLNSGHYSIIVIATLAIAYTIIMLSMNCGDMELNDQCVNKDTTSTITTNS